MAMPMNPPALRLLAMLLCFCAAAPVAAQERVLVPKATGPVPVTSVSRPFLDSGHVFDPMDLAKLGYVEEEFVVSGAASVYDWAADGAVTTRGAATPYTTRILVRRPKDARRFSGAVLVELMYTPRRWDWPMMWGYMRDGLIARGDAWVGITMPGAIGGLQKFDAARYRDLAFKNPSETPCTGAAAAAAIEDGLKWDAISQVGALLKSGPSTSPLRAAAPALYLTVQGGDLTTYMNAFHRRARLDGGRPVYDGYLARAPFAATRINQCAPAPAVSDARQALGHLDVPVISVTTQGDLPNTFALRRDDSDAANDRYRLYEVAGSGHIDKFAYDGFPSMADQETAGNAQGNPQWPFTMPCTPAIPLMNVPILSTVYDAAFDRLDAWARKNTAAPRAPRLTATAAEGASITISADDAGHGVGGVRTPYVDVPIASYTTSSAGPGTCAEMGHVIPFDAARLQSRYGSFEAYAAKIDQSVRRLSEERWLTPADARRIRAELIDAQRTRWPPK
jgi:hypothetical protein